MDDLIRRQDAIDIVAKEYQYESDRITALQKIPAVELPTWIPCSERLPEKSETYIVTGMWKGEPREIWMCKLLVLESFGAGWCNDARKPVIDAWMPLPEPYKGE